MKTRNGFVSNSSSSSFIVVGSSDAFDVAMDKLRSGTWEEVREYERGDESKAEYGKMYARTLEGLARRVVFKDEEIVIVVGMDVENYDDVSYAFQELDEYCYGRTDILVIREG